MITNQIRTDKLRHIATQAEPLEERSTLEFLLGLLII